MRTDILVCGDRRVWLGDGRIEAPEGTRRLRPLEVQLVRYLAQAEGRVVERDELMRAVWGYGRGAQSRTLDTTVKTVRKKLESDPSRPQHLLTCRGLGYRLEAARCQASQLFGRQADLEAIEGLLEGGARAVTVVGPVGVGKTSVARQVAGSGAVIVELGAVETEEELLAAMDAVLLEQHGIVDGDLERLTDPATVIVLDDADGLDRDATRRVASWAERGPPLLITRGGPLRVARERVVRLQPLATGSSGLGTSAGLALFLDAVERRCPGWASPEDTSVIAAVVQRCEGLPLALHLAADLATALSPMSLLEAVHDGLDVLERRDPEGRTRHKSLRSALAWSWDRLDGVHQEALVRLSLFQGVFSLSEACGVAEVSPRVFLDLVERSWVSLKGGAHLLLDSVRVFAAEAGASMGLDGEARRRHGTLFATQCEAASFDPHTALAPRFSDLCLALEWALEVDEPERVGPLAHAVLAILYPAAGAGETERWLSRIAQARPLAPRWATRISFWTLLAACGASDTERVLQEAPELLEAVRACEDHELERLVCALLGHACAITGQDLCAASWYEEEALAAARHCDPRALGRSLVNRAKAHGLRGDRAGQIDCLKRAIVLLQIAGDDIFAARASGMMARCEVERGRPRQALAWLAPALQCAEAEGHARLLGLLQVNHGRALEAVGDLDGCGAALDRAVRNANVVGDRHVVSAASAALARGPGLRRLP
jgi:DNA-binding winged helix-turn-helix (wHTH) protein